MGLPEPAVSDSHVAGRRTGKRRIFDHWLALHERTIDRVLIRNMMDAAGFEMDEALQRRSARLYARGYSFTDLMVAGGWAKRQVQTNNNQ
jgi:hypothetical protein